MLQEQATIEIRNASKEAVDFPATLFFSLGKPFKKQWAEEPTVKQVLPAPLAFCQSRGKIVLITSKEALLLNEVDEHQAVEHDRDVPPLQVLLRYTLDEFEKSVMLFFELLVKLLGNLFDIKSSPNARP